MDKRPNKDGDEKSIWRSRELLAAIVGAVVAAVIGTATTALMYRSNQIQREQLQFERDKAQAEARRSQEEADLYRQAYEDAPSRFARQLGDLIDRADAATKQKDQTDDVIVAAKALVSSAVDVRGSMDNLGKDLDHEIDELKGLLQSPHPDVAQVTQLVRVLKEKWQIKQSQVELDVRVSLTKLGVVPVERGSRRK